MTAQTLTVNGAARRYLLAAPPDSPESPPPLVVVLHGTGGSAEFAADETGWPACAARHGFAVAFPDGLPVDPAKPVGFLSNPRRWNDGSHQSGEPFHSATDDVGFLAAIIHDLTGRGAIDPRRVFVTGFSNGAGMAFRFAAERADLIAAVAPVAGYVPPIPLHPSRPVPTLFLVGDADPLIPIAGGPVRLPWGNRIVTRPPLAGGLARWATAIGCNTATEVVRDADGLKEWRFPGKVPFEFVAVSGLGHHWPGGKGQFNPRIAGPVSDRVNGCERVWGWSSGISTPPLSKGGPGGVDVNRPTPPDPPLERGGEE